ncbi:hypothetical protein [Endozoicomonas sp.]|nr:hypothetical protein [Endozoicomonas sp.]
MDTTPSAKILAQQSLLEQQQMEAAEHTDFETYLQNYFANGQMTTAA